MSFEMISIIIISILGTLSHFLYDFSNHNKIVGIFTSINESTWEHIKIALTPTIIWSIVDGYIYGVNPNYFFAKFSCLISIIVLMPLLFYGYNLFKKNNTIINILIFYIIIISSQYLFYYLLSIPPISFYLEYISCIGTYIIFGCYLLLTLIPLKIFLFKDPITGKYGFNAEK